MYFSCFPAFWAISLKPVSSGPARLYFTPSDVNLSIETKEAAADSNDF